MRVPEALTSGSPARSFLSTWRRLQEDPEGLRPVHLALCASFTIDPLLPYLGCFLAQRGLFAHFAVAPYNQIYQSLLDPGSAVRSAPAQVTVVLPRLEELCERALRDLAELLPGPVEEARAQAHAEIDRLCAALSEFERAGQGMLLCGTLPPARSTPLSVLDASHPASQEHLRQELNLRLWRHAQASQRLRLFDLSGAVMAAGTQAAYDPRMWYLSRCPFSDGMLRQLAEALGRAIAPLLLPPAKVIALDLDNTLWGGIVGEDGLKGIALSDSGLGAAFVAFQEALLCLRRQGVLLCVASKNNEADAFEIFDKHPAMRLRREHLSAWRINWQPKSESIRQLHKELSVGLDSFVFLDDNPVECEEVRRMLPEVTVVRLPPDPAHYVEALRQIAVLDRMVLTAEDRTRADQYAAEQKRRAAQQALIGTGQDPQDPQDPASLSAYLSSLELRVAVRRLAALDVPRAAQLTQKTNQFNLTTVRRCEAEVEALLLDPAARLYTLTVRDRFGDYGLVGLLFALKDASAPGTGFVIDTLLLSCRVLGRQVETAFLRAVLDDLCAAGATRLSARFLPTAKNAPASGFLQAHGFTPVKGGEWVLQPLLPDRLNVNHITVISEKAG